MREVIILGQKSRGKIVFRNLKKKYKNIKLVKVFKKNFNYNNLILSEEKFFDFLKLKKKKLIIFVCNVSFKLKENWNIFETYILHAGKVPEYRGASVINWQILNKEKEIFLSALKYSNKYDAGQIVLQSKIKISNYKNVDQMRGDIDYMFYKMTIQILKAKKIYLKNQVGKIKYWKKRRIIDSFFSPSKITLDTFETLYKSTEISYRPFFKKKNKYIQIIDYISFNQFKNSKMKKKKLIKTNYVKLKDQIIYINKFKILKIIN